MRRGLKPHILFTTLALVLAAGSSAQGPRTDPGAYVPGPNMPMPNYFSGTYNVVQGYVKPYPKPINLPIFPESQITYTGLKVNGVLVNQRNEDPNLFHMSVQIAGIVDSTAFAHGSTMTVEVVATDNYQRSYSDSDVSQIVNKLPTLVHQDVNSPMESTLGGHSSYQQSFELRNSWTKALYLARMVDATAFMVGTHGNGAPSITDDLPYPQYGTVTSSDVLNARMAQIGSGLPPFNLGSAPTNVYFVIACFAGSSPSFILSHLYPWEDAYGNMMHNQAGHGYSDTVWSDTASNHSVVFWYSQSLGRTIRRSVQDMIDLEVALLAWYAWHQIPYPGPLFPLGNERRPFVASADGPVWGDVYAKSRGVYTGNDTETLQWYRN